MTPTPITIDGKSGTVVYLDAKWHPVTPAHATMARVLFDDGSSAFFTTDRGAQKREYVREPAGSPKGGEFAQTRQGARGVLMDVIEGPVGVEDHPVAIRAAHETAAVLSEMKSKGYKMPSEVVIKTETRDYPAGEAGRGNVLIVEVPKNLPPEMSLDEAFAATYSGTDTVNTLEGGEWGDTRIEVRKFVGKKFRDLVIHEMGHLNQQPMDYKETTDAGIRFGVEMAATNYRVFVPAANTVSKYARTNVGEFVAEVFTALYNGETLPAETIRVYNALRGAKIL